MPTSNFPFEDVGLHPGPIDNTDYDHEDLLVHLTALRTDASKDGDVAFALPNKDRIWAHSPLFYIAAGGKLPAEFGTPQRLDHSTDRVETTKNDSGAEVTVIHISEESRPSFEEAMSCCYSEESLKGLWEAMGYSSVDPSGKGFDAGVPLSSKLPASVLPDFEIHLKAPGGRPSFCAVRVHRFLLARRIPYYATFFHSKFGDAAGNISTVYTEDFTPFALWVIAGLVYRQELKSMLSSHPEFTEYTTLRPNSNHKVPCCAEYAPDRPLPDIEIADKLVDIARAASYFQCINLEGRAQFILSELGHWFQCCGRGCSVFVPHIIDIVAKSDITDRRVITKGIHLLAQHKNISPMWKRPLLHCSPTVLELLISEVQKNSEEEGQESRAVPLFVKLSNLKRRTLSSKNPKDWDAKLLAPLMDHTVEVIAKAFDNPDVTKCMRNLLHTFNLSRPVAEELLDRIISSKTLREENCRQIFVGLMALSELCGGIAPEVEQAKKDCISWFGRKWVTLTFSPSLKASRRNSIKAKSSPQEDAIFKDRGPNNQEDSTEPPHTPTSTHWRGPPLTSPGSGRGKKLSIDTSDDGNFFSAWTEDELEKLTSMIPASIADLVAKSPQSPAIDDRYKPTRTPRGNSSPRRGVARGRRGHNRGSASISRISLGRTEVRPPREER